METSTNTAEIFAALARAQAEIEGAIKGNVNPHFRSKYADLGAVWESWQAVGPKNGLCVVQAPGSFDGRTMEMATMIGHASGEYIRSVLTIPVSKADAQGYGSATTYARRYALSAMVGICPEDDDGNAASKKPTEPAETEKAATWPEGPTKTKTAAMTAFRAVKRDGESVTTLDDFETVIDEAQPLIAQFRLADHPWWYGGSGEDKYESIPEWISRRRAELASVEQVKQQLGDEPVDPLETEFPGSTESFKMMIADMRKADAPMPLNRWKDSNRELVNSLDKTEVKAFRKAFEDHMETLQRAQKVAA